MVAEFLWWAAHDGQKYAEKLLYAPLPEAVVAIDEGKIKSMASSGRALLSR